MTFRNWWPVNEVEGEEPGFVGTCGLLQAGLLLGRCGMDFHSCPLCLFFEVPLFFLLLWNDFLLSDLVITRERDNHTFRVNNATSGSDVVAWAHEFHVTSVLFYVCRGRNWDKGSWSYLANCYQLSLIYFLTLETIWWHLFLTSGLGPTWLQLSLLLRKGQQVIVAERSCAGRTAGMVSCPLLLQRCLSELRASTELERDSQRALVKEGTNDSMSETNWKAQRGAASCWGRRVAP